MKPEQARALTDSFQGKRVLVVGDVMLDEFLHGDVSRISPEAPVPVVEFRHRSATPGGAGNAAANVVSLGGRAQLVAIVGKDSVGESLRAALEARGIDTAMLLATARPTTHKLRVVAHRQQIVRVDSESSDPLPDEVEHPLIAMVERALDAADAVLLSDYAKGVVTARIARAAIEGASRRKLPVVVDPKGRDFSKYAGATVITPNVLELEMATTASTSNEDRGIVEAGQKLLGRLRGAALLVTRGARGMTLLEAGREPLHFPTLARSVFDVTGAGDTVVGTLVLALAGRLSLDEALVLASHAARIAVSRVGTAAVEREELVAVLGAPDGSVL